jgi:hypothetical protein
MIEQMRQSLTEGDLAAALLAAGPDESYRLSFTVGEGELSGTYLRFGSAMYSTTVDTREGQEENTTCVMGPHGEDCADPVRCATDTLARTVAATRQAHAMFKTIRPDISDMTCVHSVADDMALSGTAFAETVIPDGMDPTV